MASWTKTKKMKRGRRDENKQRRRAQRTRQRIRRQKASGMAEFL